MNKSDIKEWKYYITGMRQKVKVLTKWENTMELLYASGNVRTTTMSKQVLDYFTLSEDQATLYTQIDNFKT